MIPFVDLKEQYQSISSEVNDALQGVLLSTNFILGDDVTQFEKEFAQFVGARYGVGVASGTDALHLALMAAGIAAGDEVITAANTFIATALAIAYTGARPVLVDIDEKTYTMDVAQVAKSITVKTKAVIPVHLYGQAADMDPLLALAKTHSLAVIEDACQSHGAFYKGRGTGTFGHAGCFSFYPGKNLGAYGDGGLVTTNDPGFADKIKMLRNYGQVKKYYHSLKGYNSRLDSLQAAILRVKLKRLASWNERRAKLAGLYGTLLKDSPVLLPQKADYGTHVYHLYVIRTARRDELQTYLSGRGISTGIHYPVPVHLQEAFRDLGYGRGDFSVTERCSREILSLPLYPELRESQVHEIAEAIEEFYGQHS
jgi:dTDP-4-amino-4,6-dideoxygalactose transaminase